MSAPALRPLELTSPRGPNDLTPATTPTTLLERYAAHTGLHLRPTTVCLDSGARVFVGGASTDERVFVASCGSDGSRPDHAAASRQVFALALVRQARPHARAVMVVADEQMRQALSAWVAGTPAARTVEITTCP